MASNGEATKMKPEIKSRLGRGLSALIPTSNVMRPAVEPSTAVNHQLGALIVEEPAVAGGLEIPLSQIKVNPHQPRTTFDRMALEDLTASVTAHGVLQPILVRKCGLNKYELIAGERRFRAATQAGLSSIPALVREMTDEDSLVIALIENLQREDLNVIEAARGYRRLLDEFGLTQTELARRIGKAQPTLSNALRLLRLDPKIQESIGSGLITEEHGKAILTLSDPARQLQVWERVIANRLNVAQTRKAALEEASANSSHSTVKAIPTMDVHWHALEDELRAALGMKVGILPGRGGRGTLVIEFSAAEEVEGLLERLQTTR